MLRLTRQRGDRDGRLTSKRLRTVRATSHSTVRRCRCEESGRRRSKDAPRNRAYWYMRDGEQPEILRRYFVAHVAQISRGNAQANAVNSTDLAWSRLVRDQEDGGSKSTRPDHSFYNQQFTGNAIVAERLVPGHALNGSNLFPCDVEKRCDCHEHRTKMPIRFRMALKCAP